MIAIHFSVHWGVLAWIAISIFGTPSIALGYKSATEESVPDRIAFFVFMVAIFPLLLLAQICWSVFSLMIRSEFMGKK